jgi:uncharacterized RDD family membrane protein YckC
MMNVSGVNESGVVPEHEYKYAGFWVRVGAYAIDFLLILPYAFFARWLASRSAAGFIATQAIGFVIAIVFHVYLVKRFGGSPGKVLLKLRIAKLDGTRVGYREAWLRYSVLGVISVLTSIALANGALKIPDDEFRTETVKIHTQRMRDNAPVWYQPIQIAGSIWIYSEFIVLLTNRKRRAVHDFIAGTMVIRSK